MSNPLLSQIQPANEGWIGRKFHEIERQIQRTNGGIAAAAASPAPSGFVQDNDPGTKGGRLWFQPSTGLLQISDGITWYPAINFTAAFQTVADTDGYSAEYDPASQTLTINVPEINFQVLVAQGDPGSVPAGSFDPSSQTLTITIPPISGGGASGYTGTITEVAAGVTPTITIDNDAMTIAIQIPAAPATPTFIPPRKNNPPFAGSTYTPNAGTTDLSVINTPGAAFNIAAPVGAKVDGQRLTIRIRSGATAYAATWNAAYLASGRGALPQPVAGKTIVASFEWDATAAKWVTASVDSVGY